MSYTNSEIVLSFQNHKQAALYFDNVIPIDYLPGSTGYKRAEEQKIVSPVPFLPETLNSKHHKIEFERELNEIASYCEYANYEIGGFYTGDDWNKKNRGQRGMALT